MQCERCKKDSASVHLTEIIKNVRSEIHICDKCAKEMGLNSKISKFSLSISELLSFLEINEIDEDNISKNERVCSNCGFTFIDFKKKGLLGCSDCYHYLEDSIDSIIPGYHGTKRHIGKIPFNLDNEKEKNYSSCKEPADQFNTNLQENLRLAIEEERFEDAATLRDQINEVNNEVKI